MSPRRRKGASASSIISIWTALTSVASAINFTAVSLPNIVTQDYGRMGFVGDFESISLYQYAEQGTQTYFTNGNNAIITQLPNGDLMAVAVANGHINDMCLFTAKDGSQKIIVGGNFTKLGDRPSRAIAFVDPNTGASTSVDGLAGTVNTLLCDQDSNTVFIGGEFTGGNSTNAISWPGTGDLKELPFQGFDGPVESISRMSNGTIVFGGRFTTVGNESLVSNPNGTHKITQQVVNLDSAATTVLASAGSTRPGFSEPKNIICSDGTETPGNVFLFQDQAFGTWGAEFAYTFFPTKLRIYNSNFEGRGVKLFRFVSRPNNGIMNLTSVDPSGNRYYCDAWCTLYPANKSMPYQDFNFINVIPTYAFRIDILDWYGAGGALNGVELFQDDIYAFADNTLNEPSCKSLQGPSASNVTGQWTSRGGPANSDSKYLTGTFSGPQLSDASITFRPDIKISGNYQVLVYTPGCLQDGSCGQRGRISVSGTFAGNETSQPSAVLYQTNQFDKYDMLFQGYVEANGDHTVSISLKADPGQTGPVNLVASKVRFILLAPDGTAVQPDSTSTAGPSQTTGARLNLNGVFAYDPSAGIKALEQGTSIGALATKLPKNITVNSVAIMDQTVYALGDIKADGFRNFFSIDGSGLQSVALGGLNGIVRDTFLTGKLLYLAGDFNDTADRSTDGLSHVAAYDLGSQQWSSLGAGLNGAPVKIVAMPINITGNLETTFVFSGAFTKILASDNLPETDVNGVAVWVPSKKQWLERISDAPFAIIGSLAQRIDVPNSPQFFAGSLLFTRRGFTGGVGLVGGSKSPLALSRLGIDITIPSPTIPTPTQPNQNLTQPSNQKRAVDSSLGLQPRGVQAGAFYRKGNTTILGGRFSAGVFQNLAFIKDSQVSGVPENALRGNNVVTTLLLTSNPDQLFIGGAINATVGGAPVGGMVVYDMGTNRFVSPQPQPLLAAGGNTTTVYTITQQPNGRQIYVGGSFTQVAGGFGCEGVCVYDPQTFQYFAPGFGFGGVAYASAWTDSDTLVVGGALRLNGSDVHLAQYKHSTSTWTVFANSSQIPGPVTTIFTPTGEENNIYIGGNVNNTPFIFRWDGTKWNNLSAGLRPGSVLQGIEVFEIDGVHAENSLLSQNQILMASGNILLDSTSVNSSAAIFDGTSWTPFILTSHNDGSSGSLGAFISESKHTFNEGAGKLAVGLVVLVSLAISLALVFLIVVIGVIAAYIRRRREGYMPAPTRMSPTPSAQDMTERVPPDQLFQGVGFSSREPPHI
ncbi:hypothetical protein Dda_3330 [Drechslerella dactyloides]|uniref:Cellular morphogenesis protein n=1 Tax=Drechslerella dactyloides TaxID=74499 RepID=A0AAD6J1E4_DREDA|nr:hypothetical protein Dda_3330 [Drechslerella dactyloides]